MPSRLPTRSLRPRGSGWRDGSTVSPSSSTSRCPRSAGSCGTCSRTRSAIRRATARCGWKPAPTRTRRSSASPTLAAASRQPSSTAASTSPIGAARVGLGVDFGDVTSYVADNDMGLACGLLAMHQTGFRGRIVLASSMVVYGEGRFRCREHGIVRPGPRNSADLDAGYFEPSCPICQADLAAEATTEDDPTDPRNVYAPTKLHQEHLPAADAREHQSAEGALRHHNVYGP